MNLKPLAANMTQLEINSMKILFSYQTPVAALIDEEMYQTETKWSNTTSRHINKFLSLHCMSVFGAKFKPQEYFDNLTARVK